MFNIEAKVFSFARCLLFLLEKVEENVCSCSVERKQKFQMFQSFRQNGFLQTITDISTDKMALKK